MNTTQMVLTEEKADLYDAALDHVNDVRKELGLNPVTELQQGYRVYAHKCPVATSIIHGAERDFFVTTWTDCGSTVYNAPDVQQDDFSYSLVEADAIGTYDMSDLSAEFQRAFDRGDFPELIAE